MADTEAPRRHGQRIMYFRLLLTHLTNPSPETREELRSHAEMIGWWGERAEQKLRALEGGDEKLWAELLSQAEEYDYHGPLREISPFKQELTTGLDCCADKLHIGKQEQFFAAAIMMQLRATAKSGDKYLVVFSPEALKHVKVFKVK